MSTLNEKVVYIIYLVFTLILFFINITICKMHIKQSFIRQGFFKVVFIQIIYETLIILILFTISLLYILNKLEFIYDSNYFISIPVLFNFCYMNLIFYNILTILFLLYKKEETANFSTSLEFTSTESGNDTISFKKSTFRKLHIISLFFSIIHSIIYCFTLLKNSNSFYFIYYFYPDKKTNFWIIFIFIPNLIYFIISIVYLILSVNKNKISENIRLQNYSIFCFISSFISLIFPSSAIFNNIKQYTKVEDIVKIVLYVMFLIYLINTCRFRLKRYYVQTILMTKGTNFCDKLSFGLAIFFKNVDIQVPNFIDLNSNYIYHSLANINDFVQENEDNVSESNASVSMSLVL